MRGVEQVPWLYDALIRLFPGLARWRSELMRQARGRVLEVGCGTGLGLRELAGQTERVWGIDPAAGSLQRAAGRVPSAGLAVASAEYLPFADESFDCVVSSLVFCSVGDPERGLAEIRRVLAPGGFLLMFEHVQARSQPFAGLLNTIQPAWTTITGGCHPNRHTECIVENAGFRIDPDSRRASGLMRMFLAYP
ncbi:MAG: class I SAM-dependent methyltransferase [Spiribacter salinus]|uniref:Class I SAM-dependent methyltransferase n=1 Tax=Spiribacter salinus TaxID=1335746 RepID=A0A540VNM4_9GAMM|nr:MAG: class I SAM-dependent methyltransferase [Spiribacter salinus]